MSRTLHRSAGVLAVTAAVLFLAPASTRADGAVSAFFVGTPRRGFGFVTGYGGGRYGSLLYMRGPRQTYASGYLLGRNNYLHGTFYRNRRLGVGFGGYYRPGFSATGIWVLPGRRR
jgi:hypothetical protein